MFQNKRTNKIKYGNAPIATAENRCLFVRMCIREWLGIKQDGVRSGITHVFCRALWQRWLHEQLTLFAAKGHIYIIWIQDLQVHTGSVFHRNTSRCIFFLFTWNRTRVQITLIDSQRHQMQKCHSSSGSPTTNKSFHVRAPSQSRFYARRTSEASVISPGCRLRAACTILCFVYSCVYLPILILAITRMAGHVKGRFAHSQWMGQYWQHAHRISDQCKGLACVRFTGLKLNSMRRVVCWKNNAHGESMQMLNVTLSGDDHLMVVAVNSDFNFILL